MKVAHGEGRPRRWRAWSLLALAASATACSAILGIEAGIQEEAGTDASSPPDVHKSTPDAGMDSTVTHIDARRHRDVDDDVGQASDAGSDADTAVDAVVLQTDASPLPDATFAGGVVYVGPNGQDLSNCGVTAATACQTVGKGIARAVALQVATVLVAQGTYTESIDLSMLGGLSILGGLNSSWQMLNGASANHAAVIEATSTYVVQANSLTGPVTLSTLTLKNTQPAAAGANAYGVFATSSPMTATLMLVDVIVTVGAAGNGAQGVTGAVGAPASAPPCAASGNGAAGAAGAVALAGTFSAAGYVTAEAGVAFPGSAGTMGSAGDAGCITCVSCGGFPGCGLVSAASPSCGTSGVGGCGGAGGAGGGGGESGGSSIGLFAWDAPVVTSGGSITSGNGGNGGPGGMGGTGGAGSEGVAGKAGTSCITGCTDNFPGLDCSLTSGSGPAPAGKSGGQGGTGGRGGGGAGGSSFAVYVGGSYPPALSGTSLTAGDAGAGDPGPPVAPSGTAGTMGP